MSVVYLTDEQLINLSTKELNRLLKEMDPEMIAELKQRRRALKNRGYAASSRTKINVLKYALEEECDQLRQDIDQTSRRNNQLKRTLTNLQSNRAVLEEVLAGKRNITAIYKCETSKQTP